MPDAIRDVITPPAPGSLMRSTWLTRAGVYRLARRDAELYSVLISSSGAWGRFSVSNGLGRPLFFMPSPFTGSFWLSAHAEGGIVVELAAMNPSDAADVTIAWRERDQKLI